MEDHALSLATGLAARGHAVTVVTTGHDGHEVEQVDGVEIHYLRGTPPRVYSRAWRRLSTEAIRRLHLTHGFDVLHSQSVGASDLLTRGLHRGWGLPAVVTFHGTPFDEVASRVSLIRHGTPSLKVVQDLYDIGYWAAQYLRTYRAVASAADAVIATSDQQAALMARIFRVEGRLHKVYNGMDLGVFAPAPGDEDLRRSLDLPPGGPVLLCVARFARDKGLRFVVSALPEIAAEHPDVRLVLVGDGEQRAALTQLVQRLGVERLVRFTGYVPLAQLPTWFNLCDVFVNATIRQNGYDLTMLEAMACEKVVVSSDIGSTPTLIRDGVDGLLVPPGDAVALARRIAAALRSRAQLAEMGRSARAKALSAFGLGTMVDGTLAVYDSLRRDHGR